ncbi:MAG TPA: hypothetical protein VGA78_11475, partial [Gemmatimonadales bacterium]
YDLYADERLTGSERDALIEKVTDYYLSRKEYAFAPVPKAMALMDEQYFSQGFRKGYPKFNGLIWAYHWLQVGLYEPLIVGKTPADRKAGVKATLARFWSMLEDPPNRFPGVMPITSAIAPNFSAKHPRAAVIFDNLHMMHDIISDILVADTIPRDRKRAVIYAQLVEFRDSTSNVMSMEEWRNMGEMMGGIAAMGGAATGILAAAPKRDTAAMKHGAMRHGAAAKDSMKAPAAAAPQHRHETPPPAAPRDSGAAGPARPMNAEMAAMMASMMAMHERMMADPIIRQRMLADTAMRRMMRDMMEHMPPEHREHMRAMMEAKPPAANAKKPPAHAHPPADTTRRRPG